MHNLKIHIPEAEIFSELSGDQNPLHLNKDYLIDTQFEKNLQYGANILLSALENIISHKQIFIKEITCTFLKPVKINSNIYINSQDNLYSINCENDKVADIFIKISDSKSSINLIKKISTFKRDKEINSLGEKELIKIIKKNNYFSYSLDIKKAANLYPLLSKSNFKIIEDICFISFLVGMKIPGEHSILSNIKYKYKESKEQNLASDQTYKVNLTKFRKTASYGTLSIDTCNSESKVNFFLRPSLKTLVHDTNSLISQKNDIELETVSKLISKPLKERLRHEAQRLNYMKASSKGVLPL